MAAVIAIEVACVFDSGDSQFSQQCSGCGGDALLLFRGEREIVILPREVDFLAGLGSEGGEGEDGAAGSGMERLEELGGRSAEDLKADFPAAGLDGHGGGGWAAAAPPPAVSGRDEGAATDCGGGEHTGGDRFKDLRDGHRAAWCVFGSGDRGRMRSTLPLESLMPMMLG